MVRFYKSREKVGSKEEYLPNYFHKIPKNDIILYSVYISPIPMGATLRTEWL